MDFAELTRTTGLFLMTILGARLTREPFTIRDLWFMGCQPYLKFCLRSMQSHIDMLIAHALQDRFMCDRIVLPGESHILFTETGKGWGNLRCIGLSFGNNCHTIQRSREAWSCNGERMSLIAECIAG